VSLRKKNGYGIGTVVFREEEKGRRRTSCVAIAYCTVLTIKYNLLLLSP
jgi:hypothetical protein